MALVITIDGSTFSPMPGSVELEKRLSGNSIFHASFRSDSGIDIERGDAVTVTIDGTDEFAGTIDGLRKKLLGLGAGKEYTIDCVDLSYILQRRLYANIFHNYTVQNILNEIENDVLTDEDMSLGTVDNGSTQIGTAAFNYVSVADAFDKISEATGMYWYVETDGTVNFRERSAFTAAWSLNASKNVQDITINDHRDEYRNRQYVAGATVRTDLQTERIDMNGTQTSVTVGFPVDQPVSFIVDPDGAATEKTLGDAGAEDTSSIDWFWTEGEATFSQNSDTPLTNGTIVEIQYYGRYKTVIVEELSTEVSERSSAEGGTGYYDAIHEITGSHDLPDVEEIADNLLRRFGEMGSTVSFETPESDLEPGMLMSVDMPQLDMSVEEILLDSITLRDTGRPGQYFWHVQGVTGEAVGGWESFFSAMVPDNLDELYGNVDSIVSTAPDFGEVWQETQGPPNPFAVIYPSATTQPGATTYPGFPPPSIAANETWWRDHMFMNIVGSGGTPVVRFQVTSMGDFDADNIETFYVIGDQAYAGDITALQWYAGDTVDGSSYTSGVLLEEEAYSYTKSISETMMITRLDERDSAWT